MTEPLSFELPFCRELGQSQGVLIAGAGGGFDVFSGLPLYFLLQESGRQVVLANVSFSSLIPSVGRWLTPELVEVTADSEGYAYYFPEQVLSNWFRTQGQEVPIYSFHRTGVKSMLRGYEELIERFEIDTIVLVDGGTDSLMRGDEAGLGTPAEDMASIAAANQLDLPRKILVCLGFGVDWYHGICHSQCLEAIAELTHNGGFLGAMSLMTSMPAVERYVEATTWVRRSMREDQSSIVCASILSALEGRFGGYHATERTSGDTLWVNPLMTFYWCFQVSALAARVQYLDQILETETYEDVCCAIKQFRANCESVRAWDRIPF